MKRRNCLRLNFRIYRLFLVAITIFSVASITIIISSGTMQDHIFRNDNNSAKANSRLVIARPLKIAVVTVIDSDEQLPLYQVAVDSVRCYCEHHNYTNIFIVTPRNATMRKFCTQQELMFRRHCVAAHFITTHDYDYYLFIDADVGVINPEHRIEEYIIPGKDIIFYNRIWNFEFMAGSYIAKNSPFAILFLYNWARYDMTQPLMTDNVALHNAILDFALNTNQRICDIIYKNYTETVYMTFIFEACVRDALEKDDSWSEHIGILPKGASWLRDCWLTYSKWSKHDFMLHGWQSNRSPSKTTASWIFPFKTRQNLFQNRTLCAGPEYLKSWPYDESLIRPDEPIQYALDQIMRDVQKQYRLAVGEVERFFRIGHFSALQVMRLLWAGMDDYPDFVDIFEGKATLNPDVLKLRNLETLAKP